MIISPKSRYIFVEIPLTASWAIRHELVKYYGGQPILHKHATYAEFASIATEEEKGYFVFATIRNPLDAAVSHYLKVTGDHKGLYSDGEAAARDHRIDYADKMLYERYKEREVSFSSFFEEPKVWERPYVGMIDVSAKDLDFVIRYERLQDDFTQVLRLLDIKQEREIPIKNRTDGKKTRWEDMYTQEMIPRAKHRYGPHMRRWGYEFPAEWGTFEHSYWDEVGYKMSYLMKILYLVQFQKKDNHLAYLVRRLNGIMKQRIYR